MGPIQSPGGGPRVALICSLLMFHVLTSVHMSKGTDCGRLGGVLGARRRDTSIAAHHHLPKKFFFSNALDTSQELPDGFTSRWGRQTHGNVDLHLLPHLHEAMARPRAAPFKYARPTPHLGERG